VGSVGCNTNTNVSPAANTTYTLTATGPGGTTTATRSVTFNAPVITSFGLTSAQSCVSGPAISYTWTTSNATSAVLELRRGGNLVSTTSVAANGSANGLFSLCDDTVTLVATGPGGSVSQTINAGN
jgi:hypothetical protein